MKVLKQHPGQPSENVSKHPSEQSLQKELEHTAQPLEKVPKQSPEQSSEKLLKQPHEQPSEKPSGDIPEKSSEQHPKPPHQLSKQPSEEASMQPSDQQVLEQTTTSDTNTMLEWMVSCMVQCSFGLSHTTTENLPDAQHEEDRINKVMLHVIKAKMFCKCGILLS